MTELMKQKTYSHLLHKKRMPTEYELVSSKLLYYPQMGVEVNVPIKKWYDQYQKNSPLTCRDWEQFSDPRETTYTKYTGIQKAKEIFVDGLLQSIDDLHYDQHLSQNWLKSLERILPVLRFPFHGLHMIAAYVGQMAPSGRIVIVSLMQAADEMRRVQRMAYRMRQLQNTYPSFGQESQALWQTDAMWQPLRELIERLLVTYDWGEAFVGLNLCLKPIIDELFMSQFSLLAGGEKDALLSEMFYSFNEDCLWHREWSQSLIKTALADAPQNREPIQDWINKWHPLSLRAAEAFAPLFGERAQGAIECVQTFSHHYLDSIGFKTPIYLERKNQYEN